MTKKKLLLIAILAFALSLCAACGQGSSGSSDIADHTHAYVYDLTQGTAPTEDAAGELIGKCECGNEITVPVPALSDTSVWTLTNTVPATCMLKGEKTYTSLFGSVKVEIPVNGDAHSLTDVTAVPATCAEDGVIAHKKCTACGKLFIDGVEVSADDVVAAAAHDLTPVTAVPATCTEDGVIAHEECTACGKLFIDGAEVSEDDVVAAAAHSLIDVTAVPATCESYAVAAHKKCTVCGDLFVDGTKVTLTEITGTAYAAHDYDVYGECKVCDAAKFANASFALVETKGWSNGVIAKGLITLADGSAEDTVINKNGEASTGGWCRDGCTSEITNSTLTFAFDDKTKGLLKVTASYHYAETHDPYADCGLDDVSEDRSLEFVAYYDAASNVIVFPQAKLDKGAVELNYAWFSIMVPSETAADLTKFDSTEVMREVDGVSVRPISYAVDSTVANNVNVFVDVDAKEVYVGVVFKNFAGDLVSASAIKTESAFRVIKDGSQIACYGLVDGDVIELDSFADTYTTTDPATNDSVIVNVDGHGGIVYGDVNGTYVVLADGNTLAVKLVLDGTPVYYEMTVDEDGNLVTTKPMVTLTLSVNGRTYSDEVNKNVPHTLTAAPNYVGADGLTYVFVNWANGDVLYEDGDTITPVANVTLTAAFKAQLSLTVKDEKGVRADVTVTLLDGDSIVAALKDQYGLSYVTDGFTYEVLNWHVKVDGAEVVIEESLLISADDNGAIIYVAWKDYYTIGIVDKYYVGTTVVLNESDNIVESLPAHGAYVDGYKFEGWYTDADFENRISDNAVAQEDLGFTTVYAKYSWGGDVSVELGNTYTFVYDETIGAFKSNNYHVKSSTALLRLEAVSGLTEISFDYFCESESATSYDYLTIYYSNAEGVKQTTITAGGNHSANASDPDSWGWQRLTAYVHPDFSYKEIRITYQKDSGVDKGLDAAYIKNLTINGRVITNAAPIDQFAGTYTLGEETATLNGNGIITVAGDFNPGTSTYTILDLADKKIAFTINDVYTEATIGETDLTDVTPEVTVTYTLNGHGSLSDTTLTERKNARVVLPALSEDGYRFVGWFTDEDLTNKISTEAITVSEDTTLYAKWEAAVTVTLHDGESTTVKTDYFVNDTVKSADIANLTKDGYRFDGWYTLDGTDGDWGTKVTSATVLTETDTNFYAKWSKQVTFTWMDGATEVERTLSKTYYVGDTVGVWADRANYLTNAYDGDEKTKKLEAWCTADGTDGEWGTKLESSFILTSDAFTFYAKWKNQVVVKIYDEDGTTLLATFAGKDLDCYVGDDKSAPYKVYNYAPTGYDATQKKFAGIYTAHGELGEWGDKVTSSTKLNAELVEFYAEYNYPVSVQFYDYDGVNPIKTVNKFQSEKLTDTEIPAKLTRVLDDGKVFDDWYLMDGLDYTDAKASVSTELTNAIYIYKAKYIDPSPLCGTYSGFEVYYASNLYKMNFTTIAADGTVSGFKTGKITNYNAETGTFTFTSGSDEYFGYYDASAKAFAVNYYSGLSNGLGTDTYVYVVSTTDVTVAKTALVNFDSNKTRIMTVDFGSQTMVIVMRNDKLYANVTVTATDLAGNTVEVESARIITVTRDGVELTKFSVDNGVTSDTIPTSDGFEGSYTLAGDDVAFVLDGKGAYTHGTESGTYNVNGSAITLTPASGVAVTYGINVESKTFAEVSIFAGKTFTGSYKDGENAVQTLRIEFAVSGEITGTLYGGGTSYYFDFTAVLNGNEITFTFTRTISGDQGKTLVGTISGDKITFTSCTITNRAYLFANNGSVTCAGFSLEG